MSSETLEAIKPWLNFIHPAMMWGLLALTVYALYLGMQSRRIRYVTGDEKKELVKAKPGIKHHQVGSAILAFMVLGTIGGMAVTYINNGKLFFGPHLLAGLGTFMQKGNDTARLTHISLNVILVGLFGWQAVTGMQIVQRILENF